LAIDINQVADISALSTLTKLTSLSAGSNKIADLTPLSGLESLGQVYLPQNRIADFAPLLDNPGLGSGDTLQLQNQKDAGGNLLVDCDAQAATLAALTGRGITVTSDCP
jgi:hypothetical protein